ncbi:K+/H+ antiporter subunit F [Cypionkella sp.]|jgi:multicomponent K+:H+ antiporter subunit F|uniref:K+/H+ antiporter subunit F n=1 Tax=Cypionkella sp. TaxID=2811411 RepID=UPI002719B6C7|nr:K+/H+ antiporter subunit F [Cypionkella sp.]MDO8985085.1 K+/H+ antiporter subunit F [Cypionkella sp.]MDP2047358.1 K+/H+ antiporter subunit F [Cypionkella sp.]
MLTYALPFAITCFALALILNLIRLATAPSMPDRILTVDTMVINVIALIVLYGVQTHATVVFDAALLLAMTGFISTIAFCKFLLRGGIIE